MDWNFDGKVDARDDALFLEVIEKEETKKVSQPHHHKKNQSMPFRLTGLGKVVLWILAILVVAFIFDGGEVDAVWNLIEIGFIVFLFAQGLDR